MFGLEKLMLFKTKIEPEKEPPTEQEDLTPVKEPDTRVVDVSGTVSYLGAHDESFSDVNILVDTYRSMASNFEVSEALDEIENDAIVVENDESVSLNLDRLELKEQTKEKISKEFDTILNLLDWDAQGHKLFRRWYVDGRLYQQKVMHKNTKNGIEKIVTLNVKKTSRFKKRDSDDIFYKYEYDDKKTYVIPGDGLTFTPSGILDPSQCYYISELHKSIRPLNNYRLMWDSALIYYITRAPQKRAFYIDVGNTPPKKAEELVKKMMQKFRQRISYDSTSGKVTQNKRSIPVNEDYYLATRGDTRGTRIDTLEGDTNLLDPEIMNMYKKQLYKSLGVPFARVDEDGGGMIDYSNQSELSRQELKMSKSTQKRRKRFSVMFDDLLQTQLIAKKIIAIDEWDEIKQDLFYVWKNDSYTTMAKQQEILAKQIELAVEIEPFIGKYFSNEYVRKFIFKQSDEDIKTMDEQIKEDTTDERYKAKPEDEE